MPQLETEPRDPMAALSQTATSTLYPVKELIKVFKWARSAGATQIRAHGIEIDFIEPDENASAQVLEKPMQPHEAEAFQRQVTTNAEIGRNFLEENLRNHYGVPTEPSQSTEKNPPAISLGNDDPDLFARDSDIWASQTRLPRR